MRTGIAANRFAGASLRATDGAGQGVSLGRRDRADQELQVVAVRPELLGQQVEQLGVRRRVVVPHVIDRIDDPGAEEPGPDAIDRRPGEVRVVGRGHPVGQELAPGRPTAPLRFAWRRGTRP